MQPHADVWPGYLRQTYTGLSEVPDLCLSGVIAQVGIMTTHAAPLQKLPDR
jgi:hypothetical protein